MRGKKIPYSETTHQPGIMLVNSYVTPPFYFFTFTPKLSKRIIFISHFLPRASREMDYCPAPKLHRGFEVLSNSPTPLISSLRGSRNLRLFYAKFMSTVWIVRRKINLLCV